MLKYITTGESHGKCLIAVVEGLPAGLKIDTESINRELARRQGGYGRGPRMKIEKDTVELLSGTRKGLSIGSPIALKIKNADYSIEDLPELIRARPGHADLAGAMKYSFHDMRNVLERASARETAARVSAGTLANTLLKGFNINVLGYVVGIGGFLASPVAKDPQELRQCRDASPIYCPDKQAGKAMLDRIKEVEKAGDTVGGIIEVVAFGVPPGLGSYAQWTDRLDGRLARAAMAVQAIKGVEIGLGFVLANASGSQVHDEIFYDKSKKGLTGGFYRKTNNAGGLEGGITNGEPVVLRAAMKPIPTLRKPLASVELSSKKTAEAAAERSDVCAVPAASVVLEAVVAFELASAFLEKFGGDSVEEVKRNYAGYLEQIRGL
ncbi:MAG: chorismate synthase [Planctomycetes bacterium RIFCSPHIGHO2_02_FULL_52_58]|nr:MAG: chorismate synthase [Planctomycetes bacterium RIFCSPHIGHO2_02_FULL_52_58]